MSRSYQGIAVCPRCHRTVSTNGGRYSSHKNLNSDDANVCELSLMHVPYRADQQSAMDYVGRAHIVANLAATVQDADPAVVWDYITALPPEELQRLMMLALAALPIEQTVAEMWDWVCDLPAAKSEPAQEKNAA